MRCKRSATPHSVTQRSTFVQSTFAMAIRLRRPMRSLGRSAIPLARLDAWRRTPPIDTHGTTAASKIRARVVIGVSSTTPGQPS